MEAPLTTIETAGGIDLSRSPTLYSGVADWIISCIDRGIYKVGDRVPSIRSLSATMQVSINTVREAYELLERRCYVECRPQSGYFVLKTPPPSIPERSIDASRLDLRDVVFCRIYAEMKSRGTSPEAANLAVAMPDSAPFGASGSWRGPWRPMAPWLRPRRRFPARADPPSRRTAPPRRA